MTYLDPNGLVPLVNQIDRLNTDWPMILHSARLAARGGEPGRMGGLLARFL